MRGLGFRFLSLGATGSEVRLLDQASGRHLEPSVKSKDKAFGDSTMSNLDSA